MSDIYEMLDSIQALKDKRDAIVENYDGQIKILTDLLEKKMAMVGQDKTECATAIAYWRKGNEVVVEDWTPVMKFVKENDAFDILQKRISPDALSKRLASGATIAGVTVKPTKTFIVQRKK